MWVNSPYYLCYWNLTAPLEVVIIVDRREILHPRKFHIVIIWYLVDMRFDNILVIVRVLQASMFFQNCFYFIWFWYFLEDMHLLLYSC